MSEDFVAVSEMLAASDAPYEVKIAAMEAALPIATPLAKQQAAMAADGQILKLLMELVLKFLPILLELLKG